MLVDYDRRRDRLLVFGGSLSASDLWALDLATNAWQLLLASGTGPAARRWPSGAYDVRRDRLVICAGTGTFPVAFSDAWAATFAGSPAWESLGFTPASNRSHQAFALDDARDRLIVTGGLTQAANELDDTYAWVWTHPLELSVMDHPAGRPRMVAGPNPSARATSVAFSLSSAVEGTVDIHDVTGRWVRRLLGGRLPAGDHVAVWDGRNASGEVAPPGVYFCTLDSSQGRSTTRIVLLGSD
jgi:hypothetical protein